MSKFRRMSCVSKAKAFYFIFLSVTFVSRVTAPARHMPQFFYPLCFVLVATLLLVRSNAWIVEDQRATFVRQHNDARIAASKILFHILM